MVIYLDRQFDWSRLQVLYEFVGAEVAAKPQFRTFAFDMSEQERVYDDVVLISPSLSPHPDREATKRASNH